MLCIYLKMSIQYNKQKYNNLSTNYNNLAQYVMHISQMFIQYNNYNYNNLSTTYNNLAQYVVHISKNVYIVQYL